MPDQFELEDIAVLAPHADHSVDVFLHDYLARTSRYEWCGVLAKNLTGQVVRSIEEHNHFRAPVDLEGALDP